MRERRDNYLDPMSLVLTRRRQEEFSKYQTAAGEATVDRINDVYRFGSTMYRAQQQNPFLSSIPGVEQAAAGWYGVGVMGDNPMDAARNVRPQGFGIQTYSREVRQPGYDLTGRTNPIIINMPTGLSPRSGNRSGDR